jgi:hypothetical protein
MKIALTKIDPARVTVLYDPRMHDMTYYVDGVRQYGFNGPLVDCKIQEALESGFSIQLTSVKMDTQTKIRQFHAILAKKGIMDLKAEILAAEGVESTKDLSEIQLDDLINRLQTVQVSSDVREFRSLVLNLLGKLGITGSKEEGWNRVNEYLMQPRISGKTLYAMTGTELKDCAARLRSIIHKAK